MGRYAKYIWLLFFIGLATSLARSYQRIVRTRGAVEQEKAEIQDLKSKNTQLQEDLVRVKSAEYIEKQLRDKLGLARAGEIVLVLPDAETLKKLAPPLAEEEETLPPLPWEKWRDIFF